MIFKWFRPPECNTLRLLELYYCVCKRVQACVKLNLISMSVQSFYSSRPDGYIETRGPTCGTEVVGTLYNI
jgi:hypothetical protein